MLLGKNARIFCGIRASSSNEIPSCKNQRFTTSETRRPKIGVRTIRKAQFHKSALFFKKRIHILNNSRPKISARRDFFLKTDSYCKQFASQKLARKKFMSQKLRLLFEDRIHEIPNSQPKNLTGRIFFAIFKINCAIGFVRAVPWFWRETLLKLRNSRTH